MNVAQLPEGTAEGATSGIDLQPAARLPGRPEPVLYVPDEQRLAPWWRAVHEMLDELLAGRGGAK